MKFLKLLLISATAISMMACKPEPAQTEAEKNPELKLSTSTRGSCS